MCFVKIPQVNNRKTVHLSFSAVQNAEFNLFMLADSLSLQQAKLHRLINVSRNVLNNDINIFKKSFMHLHTYMRAHPH